MPEEHDATELADLQGLRVATVFPRLAREELRARGIAVELVEVTGSVEVAPRLGLADAIVDLVSSGSTMRTNGLRSLGSLFRSEAVLVGGPVTAKARDARHHPPHRRRCACRAVPDAERAGGVARGDLRARPGLAGAERAPLAEPGMVAVHALVPAADIWRLLPRLERAGASSILLVPVERMLG